MFFLLADTFFPVPLRIVQSFRLANIGSVLNTTLEDAGVKYKTFIDSLQSCLDVVNHNRQELAPQTAQAAAITGSYHDEEDKDDDLLDDLGDN